MQVDVLSRSPGTAQAAQGDGLPSHQILIVAQRPGEVDEARNFIVEAMNIVSAGPTSRGKSAAVALKVMGLLLAAARKATVNGAWSVCGTHDPLADFLALQSLVNLKLPRVRGPKHPISRLRIVVADAINGFRRLHP